MKSAFNLHLTRVAVTAFLCFSFNFPCLGALALDPDFAGGGKLTISFPDATTNYFSQGIRIFVQPSGRILAGGIFTNQTPDGQMTGVAMVGLTSAGALDSGFGSGGLALDWRSDASTSFRDALMYADGSTLRLSQVLRLPAGSRTARVVRLNANGEEGNVITIGEPVGFSTVQPVQVAVRSDGRILVLIADGGYFLHRFNSDGTSDTTFGVNGRVGIVFNKIEGGAPVIQMIALNDGKILLIGNAGPFDTAGNSSDFFIARLTETGNWDKSFGRVGFVRKAFAGGTPGRANEAIVQPDGKILLCGSVTDSDTDTWMMRLRSNGRADSSFGTDGVVIRDFTPGGADGASSTALSADAKIRLVGTFGSTQNFLLARFAANGTFEESIGISFTPDQYARGSHVAMQADGKILVIGDTKNPASSGSMFAIARLTE